MKTKNHGFSLVELVVVVAIMAILVGIITPAYLSYLEKTRIQKDESAAGEIYRAAEIAVYSGEYDITGTVVLTFSSSGIEFPNAEAINSAVAEEILQEHFGDSYQTAVPVSKKYKDKTYSVTLDPPEEGSEIPKVSGSWSS